MPATSNSGSTRSTTTLVAAEYATARVLAESARLSEATPRILEAICTSLGWQHGALWRVDHEAGLLRCVTVWPAAGDAVSTFETQTLNSTFPSGVGLP